MKKNIILILGLILVLGSALSGQQAGNVGINMRVDPAPRIGLTYHLSAKFALRPYVGFSIASEERENEFIPRGQLGQPEPIILTGERTEDSTRVTAGLGLLYYFYVNRSMSVYSGADFSYTRNTVDVELSLENRDGWKNRGEIFGVNALLGLQCRLLENLGIFGEVGLGYSSASYEHENRIEAVSESRRWGLTNSGIGLVFYF